MDNKAILALKYIGYGLLVNEEFGHLVHRRTKNAISRSGIVRTAWIDGIERGHALDLAPWCETLFPYILAELQTRGNMSSINLSNSTVDESQLRALFRNSKINCEKSVFWRHRTFLELLR